MKTGRSRKKTEPIPEPVADIAAEGFAVEELPEEKPPPPEPTKRSGRRFSLPLILGVVGVIIVILIVVMALGGGADEWVEATQANGAWTTTAIVFGPQVVVEERWETDCTDDSSGMVRAGTCVMKDAGTYQDTVVDDYEEYAYNIYYEETAGQVYEVQETEFVVTALGSDDWWEENLHYTRQEELDRESCEYTDYTIWIDDLEDQTQEIEVYLAECEVWDHVVVEERVYDQALWCQCDVTTLVEVDQQSDQGSGLDVRWSDPSVPEDGRTERSFKGQVTFLGDDHSYTTTTDDLSEYQDYMTSQYYIGLKEGEPVTVSKNPPED